MKTVDLPGARAQLSRLVDEAVAGKDIVITRAGKPLVRLTPVLQRGRRTGYGADRGKIKVKDNFDDPLPDDLQRAFGAGRENNRSIDR